MKIAIALLALFSLQLPPSRGQTRRQQPARAPQSTVFTSIKNEKMAAPFCRNPFMAKSGGGKSLMSRIVEPSRLDIDGTIDPKNPHVLTGTKTETIDRNGGTMTIT